MSRKSFATVIDSFRDSLHKHPDLTAVHVLERAEAFALSYADLERGGRSAAKGFQARHVRAGDRVILAIPTSRDFFAVYLGALFSGVIPILVPTPRSRRPAQSYAAHVEATARAVGAGLMIATPEIRAILAGLSSMAIVTPAELGGDGELPQLEWLVKETDIAHLQATSGTTGVPKYAVIRHRNIAANVEGIGTAIRHRDSDLLVTWLPFFHDMGLIGISYGLYWQCPLIATDAMNFIHNPLTWLQMISRFGATISPAPNSAYHACARLAARRRLDDLDLSSWRVALCGAEPVHEDTIRRFTEEFAPYGLRATTMLPVYGLAEATLAATIPDVESLPHIDPVDVDAMEAGAAIPATARSKRRLAMVCVGAAIPGHEVRITDRDGATLGEREIGEIELAGPSVIEEYWDDPRESIGMKRADGFLRTGDLGYLAAGKLYVTGRQKDLIIVNGRNLVPANIEAAMAKVVDTDLAIVACGIEDARSGTESLLLIIESRVFPPLDPTPAEEKLHGALESLFGLSGTVIHWVKKGEIPKTSSGKVQRRRCREWIAARAMQSAAPLESQLEPQRRTSWIPPTA